jgi:protein-tyrosine phosphatase
MVDRVSVLFVCMGNICRSPMAHGAFRKLVARAGLADRVMIDSAGTIDHHAGDPPDPRAVATAGERGIDISDLRARALTATDCGRFDLIVAMDRGNLNRVRAVCNGHPATHLLLEFAPQRREHEVPDPYSGGPAAFETVMDLIEAGTQGLLAEVAQRLDGGAP